MQITIYDQAGAKPLQYFAPGKVKGVAYTLEEPYGELDATFELPIKFQDINVWAKHFNQVEIYDSLTERVWQGIIYGVGPKFTDRGVNLKISCVGWVAKLGMLTTATNLANEKGSAYITAHILGDTALSQWVTAGTVGTTDYTILATRDYSARKPFRVIMDDINSFNGWSWQVRGKQLFFEPFSTEVEYYTHARYVRGDLEQNLSDFGNKVHYNYKTTAGVLTVGSVTDTDSEYPETHKVAPLGEGLTAAEALAMANLTLDGVKTLRSTKGLTVTKIWDANGMDIPLSQVRPGKLISIGGVAVNPSTLSAAFAENDIDVFRIAQVKYSNDNKNVTLSPGKVSSRLPVILARMGLRK